MTLVAVTGYVGIRRGFRHCVRRSIRMYLGLKERLKRLKKQEPQIITTPLHSMTRSAPPPPDTMGVSGEKAYVRPSHYHICTVAGVGYLIRVLSLYESLATRTENFTFYVCCIDDNIYNFLKVKKLPRLVPYLINDIETPRVEEVKRERTASEFCWTIKSWFMEYLFETTKIEHIVYCDSDLCFFGDPALLFDDWGAASVYLCHQRDLDWVQEKYGYYQAGLVGFKNNPIGRKAVCWWRDKCLEWCYFREDPTNKRWGDQKYLDQVPQLFGDAKVTGHLGIDAAPWNSIYNNGYNATVQNGQVYIQHLPLVVYHFSCMDIFDEDHYDLWNLSKITIQQSFILHLYLPYIDSLRRSIASAKSVFGKNVTRCLSVKDFNDAKTTYIYNALDTQLFQWEKTYCFCAITSREYIVKTVALYESLRQRMDNFHFWICCMDQESYDIVLNLQLPKVTLLPLSAVANPAYNEAVKDRNIKERCWTLKPVLCKYILKHYNIDQLLYCDSDLFFFDHPDIIAKEWEGHVFYMARQRATDDMHNKNGIYQAGLLGFSNEARSREILDWWEAKCLEWCYDSYDLKNQRWGDQKYLDQVPLKFTYIRVSENEGVNLAPWNLVMNPAHGNHISEASGKVYINGKSLIVYHFGSLNILSETEADIWKLHHLNFDFRILKAIYLPYLKALNDAINRIRPLVPDMKPYYFESKEELVVMNYLSLN